MKDTSLQKYLMWLRLISQVGLDEERNEISPSTHTSESSIEDEEKVGKIKVQG